jgi:hypothetical protein
MEEMRHVRMLGFSLVAVFAIVAVAASAASAKTPEWGQCVAQAGGKYLDSNCQEKGKGGSFEWKKGATLPNNPFTGSSVGSGGVLTTGLNLCNGPYGGEEGRRVSRGACEAKGDEVFESPGHVSVECENETNTGEAVGKNKVANVLVTFTGCKIFGSAPCTGKGLAEGEIRTSTLKGELGYIDANAHEVGLKLEPATKHGPFAVFVCEGVLKTVVGVGNKKEGANYQPESKGGNDQIISPITPVNAMTTTYTQVYTVNYSTPVQNVPSKFENKSISLLEDYLENPPASSMWSPAGEEITNVNTPSEPGEIKA